LTPKIRDPNRNTVGVVGDALKSAYHPRSGDLFRIYFKSKDLTKNPTGVAARAAYHPRSGDPFDPSRFVLPCCPSLLRLKVRIGGPMGIKSPY